MTQEKIYEQVPYEIEKRISEHKLGKMACYTKKRLPVKLVFMQSFVTRCEAVTAEQ